MRKILLLSMVSMLLLVVVLSACGINFAGKATEFGNLTNGTTTNATTCTNNCSTLGQTTCSGNYVKTCGDYDGNSCLEWNTGTYCSNGCSAGACLAAPAANATNTTNTTTSTTICTDSDSGLNYNVKGTVTVSNGTTFSDFCSGVYNLKEYVCNGTEVNNDWSMYRCPSGYNCTNGACTVNATTSNATVTNITGTGSIYATSIPTGAYVSVDRVNYGITPKVITGVAPGNRQVLFAKSVYNNTILYVNVVAGQTTNVSANMTLLGSIYATSVPTGATVYVDNINKGITPKVITGVAPGNRQVKFTKTGYNTVIKTATVTGGQRTNVAANLTMI